MIQVLKVLWVLVSNLPSVLKVYREAKAQGKANDLAPKIREAFREKNADKLNQYFNS